MLSLIHLTNNEVKIIIIRVVGQIFHAHRLMLVLLYFIADCIINAQVVEMIYATGRFTMEQLIHSIQI